MKKIFSFLLICILTMSICVFAQHGIISRISSVDDPAISHLSAETKELIRQKIAMGGEVFYANNTSSNGSMLYTANTVVELPSGAGVFDYVLDKDAGEDAPFDFKATKSCRMKVWYNTLSDEDEYSENADLRLELYTVDGEMVFQKTVAVSSNQLSTILKYTLEKGCQYRLYVKNVSGPKCHFSFMVSGV